MPTPRKYPWPLVIGAVVEIAAPDSATRARLQSQAHIFSYRKRWVYRTRWDGAVVRVRRVA